MITRRALFVALLRRELTLEWLGSLTAVVVLAVWVGTQTVDSATNAASVGLMPRLLRRFDLLVLGMSALLCALRVAQRTAEDFSSGWLEPYKAMGARPGAYVPLLVTAVSTSRFVWFAIAAIAYAVTIAAASGSPELFWLLPSLLPAALLLLACVTAYAAIFAIATREAVSAIVAAALLTAAPLVAVTVHVQRNGGEAVPRLLRWWVASYPPPLELASSLRDVWPQLLYVGAASALVTALSRYYAGRRP